MTLLERWDTQSTHTTHFVSDAEIRRAIAVAQAVDDLSYWPNADAEDGQLVFAAINRRADELLRGGK